MHKRLSRRPSVEFYHKQANRFLKAHRKGDAEIRNRLFASLPELGNVTEKGKLATRLSLKDMLRMIALEHGFRTWADMKREIVSRRIIALPAFSSIAGGLYEQRIMVIMKHVAKASMHWGEALKYTEVTYDRVRFTEEGRIGAVICHAERSRVRDIEVAPSDEMSSWRFSDARDGEEFYVGGTTLHLSDRLQSHPSQKVRSLASQHRRESRAGRGTNQRLQELLAAVTEAEVPAAS